MLFADDAAITTDTERLQCLMDKFSHACKDLKKNQVMAQDVRTLPVISIDNYKLDVVHQFTYIGSTISENLSLDAELNHRIWEGRNYPWQTINTGLGKF